MARFSRVKLLAYGFATVCLAFAPVDTFGYVDLAPTLTKILADAKRIVVVEVVSFDREQHVIEFKELRALKGELSNEPTRHTVTSSAIGSIPLQINQWAEPGAQAVLFESRNAALVCLGQGWYAARLNAATNSWQLGADRPDLPLAYYGPVSKLANGIVDVLDGKDAIITAVAYGAENVQTSLDLALARTNLPAIVTVQRLRMNSKMPAMVMATAASSAYVVGQGPVDKNDLPALLDKLQSTDANVRAEAASDLGWLGKSAAPAKEQLTRLLQDRSPRVRQNAAAALLQIEPKNPDATKVLDDGLSNKDAATRRNAAQAVGFAGRAAGDLTPQLVVLLDDKDEAVRVAALQAISTLGVAAAKAVPTLKKLLDNPVTAIDAADALGRIGPASRPIPESLVAMLSSSDRAVQWAAVRAISQIGGNRSDAAVKFMVEALPSASHVEQYNMMIYFALLGPDARDAMPVVRDFRAMMNPMLKPATLWAMDPEASFPWAVSMGFPFGGPADRGGPPPAGAQTTQDNEKAARDNNVSNRNGDDPNGPGGFGDGPNGPGGFGPGGFGGGPNGPGGFGGGFRGPPGGGGPGGDGTDLARYIFEAYFIELDERLAPSTRKLANAILEGKEGAIPTWGYKLLSCAPNDAVKILVPKLKDKELAQRERAAVALGYMGPTAVSARDQLRDAVTAAQNEQERLLMQWSLREVESVNN
jgi:HEAT repeat protein